MRKKLRKFWQSILKKRYSSRLALGVVLVVVGVLLILAKEESTLNLSKSFETEPVKLFGFGREVPDQAKIPKKVVIPEISVDLEVKPSKIVDGYWQVFEDSAGWGEGSGIPGESGNQVIFAHAREGLFSPLRKVKKGSRIYVLTEQQNPRLSAWYSYEVDGIKEVFPNQVEVIAPTEDERLTLYTCSGFTDSKRLIVVAKRAV